MGVVGYEKHICYRDQLPAALFAAQPRAGIAVAAKRTG